MSFERRIHMATKSKRKRSQPKRGKPSARTSARPGKGKTGKRTAATKNKRRAQVRRQPKAKASLPPSPPKQGKPYYITTSIAYPNGPPHLGYAYEVIATDAIARFMRLDGRGVFFLTGTVQKRIKIM